MPCRITTHILDLQRGVPAANVGVELSVFEGAAWQSLANAFTNEDGRITQWYLQVVGPESDEVVPLEFEAGHYQLRFATADYFELQGISLRFSLPSPSSSWSIKRGPTITCRCCCPRSDTQPTAARDFLSGHKS